MRTGPTGGARACTAALCTAPVAVLTVDFSGREKRSAESIAAAGDDSQEGALDLAVVDASGRPARREEKWPAQRMRPTVRRGGGGARAFWAPPPRFVLKTDPLVDE